MSVVDLPRSTLRWLRDLPATGSVAMLLRHAARPPLRGDASDATVPITEAGEQAAAALGRQLGPRLVALHTSPLTRCVQTAEAMRGGAALDAQVRWDRRLGDPGVFVIDDQVAAEQWARLGHEAVMAHLVGEDTALPGMAVPRRAAWVLVEHMLTACDDGPGVHVFLTHDSLVTATAARALGEPLGREDWPAYLEAAFFWREGDAVGVAYRDLRRACPWPEAR